MSDRLESFTDLRLRQNEVFLTIESQKEKGNEEFREIYEDQLES